MNIPKKNISLMEDHDTALKVWRKNKIKDLDLVHIDAHIDFDFHRAKRPAESLSQAKSLKEFKRSLEYSLVFRQYEKDLDKQTNIGNYIYPAMQEGIVKDFYWVVPGGIKEFVSSCRIINNILRGILSKDRCGVSRRIKISPGLLRKGRFSVKLLGRKFVICILEKLPVLGQRTLLDIDTDFLVVRSLSRADSLKDIGKRKPWIYPEGLAGVLKKKIKHPENITIAYSVNGGFTPIKYKHLGDELAYWFLPQRFEGKYRRSLKAAEQFNLFKLRGVKEFYWKANKLNPAYRASDNNYGPLYLCLGRLSLAKGEFEAILKVDPDNVFSLSGLGQVYLQKKEFAKAGKYFSLALKQKEDLASALIGSAQAEFKLGNFKKAKGLFIRYQKLMPLEPRSYYFLGKIYEKQKLFKDALNCYQDAIKLSLNDIDIIRRIIKISTHIKLKYDTIIPIINSFNNIKRWIAAKKTYNLADKKCFIIPSRLEKNIILLENRIKTERSRFSDKG